MIDYSKLLRESKDKKFNALQEKKETGQDDYTCNYCPGDNHKYCTHDHCILDKEWQDKVREETILRQKLQAEEDFLKHGMGCYGYDFKTVYKNVVKLRRELKEFAEKR